MYFFNPIIRFYLKTFKSISYVKYYFLVFNISSQCGKKSHLGSFLSILNIRFLKKTLYISYGYQKPLTLYSLNCLIKMKKFEEVKKLIADLEGDADKFYNKGNSAAGTRVRKGMQDLKNLSQAIRLEVQETKNKAAGQ